MKFVERLLGGELTRAARAFSAVILTGPRRSGKTSLLRHAFPGASYYLLEDPDVVARIRADPRTFLDDISLPAILDEIQHAPEILSYVRTRIDQAPRKTGQWLLIGSQLRLKNAIKGYDVTGFVVHGGPARQGEVSAVRPGVSAVSSERLLSILAPPGAGRPLRRRDRNYSSSRG